MMEQAAADRQLFAGSPRDNSGSPMRFPEYVHNTQSADTRNAALGHDD